MVIPSQARKVEVIKKTQYVKGKIKQTNIAFPCPAWFFPYTWGGSVRRWLHANWFIYQARESRLSSLVNKQGGYWLPSLTVYRLSRTFEGGRLHQLWLKSG